MDDWQNWLIDVDAHVIEPPHVWQSRVPEKFKDQAPQWIRDDAGEAWLYEGKRLPQTGLNAVSGTPREEWSPRALSMDTIRDSSYDPTARVRDMDLDGILAAVCFPTFPRFCGQTFYEASDKELAHLCVRAYNDWMIDEWSGSAPGRFLPLIIIPLWDPIAAAKEIERCADKGAKAIAFSENPSPLGLPSIFDADRYWHPVFDTAAETGLPICTHIGSSSALPVTAPDAPNIVSMSLTGMNAQATVVDWLYSGNLLRYPKLKLVLSEGGVSFMPGLLEKVQRDLDRQGPWNRKMQMAGDWSVGELTVSDDMYNPKDVDVYGFDPYEVYRNQIYNCIIADYEYLDYFKMLGTNNVMLETDFPHTESSWPNTIQEIATRVGSLSEVERFNVQLGNACRVFHYDLPKEPPSRAKASTVPSTASTA